MIENPLHLGLSRATTLVVLAGGEGRRMGIAKSQLKIDGAPILIRLLDRLQWPGPTLLVTAPGREQPPGCNRFDAEILDAGPGEGPLRGIRTVLDSVETEYAILLPVDMPNIGKVQLSWMIAQLWARPGIAGLMCARQESKLELQPLPLAVRAQNVKPIVASMISSGNFALRSLADDSNVLVEPPPADWPVDFWMNLNLPEDLSSFSNHQV